MCFSKTGGAPGGLDIRRDKAAEAMMLHTDIDRLAQVFINLIANVRKYCDADDPVLEIRAERDSAGLTVDFVDNGTGIPIADEALIFEKFSRLGDTGAPGAGLGLAICREIMHRLGGSIAYLPGQRGAAFRITLPQTPH